MKKIIKLLLIIFLISINITYLKADCESDKEAVKDISVDKKNYMFGEKALVGFEIYSMVPADLYVEVTKDSDTTVETVEMKNGYLDYSTEYDNKSMELSVNVLSKSCPGEILDSFEVYGTKLNVYSGLAVCATVAGSSELCGNYADVGDMTEEDFTKAVQKDIRSTMATIRFKVGIKKYIYLAIIPFFVFGIGYMIALKVLKEKRKNAYRGGGIK